MSMIPSEVKRETIKRDCLKMYVNGIGLRAIEWVKGVHHTTVVNWVKQVGKLLPDVYDPEVILEVGELDELQTYVKQNRQDIAVDSVEPL
jgi:insertion element IS1 protein InsB